MHKQASVASAITNPGKVIDQNKRIRANRNVPTTNELSRPIELRPEALQVLQAVAMSFLESSFNRKFSLLVKGGFLHEKKLTFHSFGTVKSSSLSGVIIGRHSNAKT